MVVKNGDLHVIYYGRIRKKSPQLKQIQVP